MDENKLKKELYKRLKVYSEMNNHFLTERDCEAITKFSSEICIKQIEKEEKDKEKQYCKVCGVDITDIDNTLFCESCAKPNIRKNE